MEVMWGVMRMPIPDYQTIMLPLLKVSSDGQEHSLTEVVERLANEFSLSAEDRREMIPSGAQPRFDNRVAWARTYMKKAGLLESTTRGKLRITERGLQTLQQNLERIDNSFLSQFPEFREFKGSSPTTIVPPGGPSDTPPSVQTPEEVIATNYQGLRRLLAEDLLQRVKNFTPTRFEKLVLELLVAIGYGGSMEDAAQALGGTGDGGVDGVIKQDPLGLDVVYVQAKKWDGTVGRPVIQAFAGSLMGRKASKGVFMTTSQFSQDAQRFVTEIEKKIVLIDGEELVDLMIDHEIGVVDMQKYVLKRVDPGYFDEDE